MLSPYSKKDESLEEYPIIKKIAKDSTARVDVTSLVGCIGRASSDDNIRIYPDLEFREYFEIKRNDILRNEKVSGKIIEFRGSRIWIKSDAEILHIQINRTKEQAKFLTGKITDRYLRPQVMVAAVGRVRPMDIPPTRRGCQTVAEKYRSWLKTLRSRLSFLGRRIPKEMIVNFVGTHPGLIQVMAALGISFAFSFVGRTMIHEILQPAYASAMHHPLPQVGAPHLTGVPHEHVANTYGLCYTVHCSTHTESGPAGGCCRHG